MRFSGTVEIEAPRERVWDFLMDPNQVGSCGPGVQSIEEVDADHFNIRAKVGVGFITATFTIHAEFLEREERARAKIGIRGQAPGSAVDGYGEMVLRDDPSGGTTMDWSTEVNIHGTIASVGARLIEGTANKLIGQTFACIKSKLEVAGVELRTAAAAAAHEAEPEIEVVTTAADAASVPDEAAAPLLEAAQAGAAAEPAAEAAEGSAEEPAIASAEEPAIAVPSAAVGEPPVVAHARLQYVTEPIGPAGTNVYLFGNPDTGEAIAVDVAHPSLAWVATQLKARNWRLTCVVTTHGHWDHQADNAAVVAWARQQATAGATDDGEVALAVHPDDREDLVAPRATFAPFEVGPSFPTLDLVEGGRLRLGTVEFEVLHTPGHTPGSVSLFVRGANLLVSGDTLLAGGWGRTDLPGGSASQMAESIRRLAALGDEVQVLPGHGPATTIGRERGWINGVLEGQLLR